MFHKHDDRLRQLNEELLAEDEEYFEMEYEEDELNEEDLADLLGEEEEVDIPEFFQNHANGYDKDIRNFANHYGKGSPTRFDDEEPEYEEDDLEDEEFLYRDDYKAAKKAKKKAEKADRKEKRKKLGLAVIALVELIAIIGILAWWASWIL